MVGAGVINKKSLGLPDINCLTLETPGLGLFFLWVMSFLASDCGVDGGDSLLSSLWDIPQ